MEVIDEIEIDKREVSQNKTIMNKGRLVCNGRNKEGNDCRG